tara:strand:- start:47 stop:292 length:246 start_codon:yes stop_codon:yes gene_type:complete
MESVFIFAIGNIVGAGIAYFCFQKGADTFEDAVTLITQPIELSLGEKEDESKTSTTSEGYDWDDYEEHIKELNGEPETDLN